MNYIVAAKRRAPGFTFFIMLAFVFTVTPAQAQTDAAGKTPTVEATNAQTTDATKTRERRVVETATPTASEPASSENVEDEKPLMIAKEPGSDRLNSLRSQIKDAKTNNERARLQRMLIDYMVALNKKNEAIAELRTMMREERIDPVGFYNIGNALARLGDTDTAIDSYRKAINQRHGNYPRALNNLGVMLLRQGRWEEAQETFVNALKLENFRYAEASYNLGRVYAARGEADLAIREWSRTLFIAPDHTDAAIQLARTYAEDGSPERGISLLDKLIARLGPNTDLTDARREILFGVDASSETSPSGTAQSSKNSNDSMTAEIVADSKSKNTYVTTEVGKIKPEVMKRSSSLRTLTVNRETYDLLERARAAREGGRHEDAITLYRRVLGQGFLPPANLELSFVLAALKQYEEAAATLITLTKREGARYPIAYYHLGRYQEALGNFQLAAEAFENAVAAYGDENPQFLLDVSRVRQKEGNTQAALEAMEAFVRISKLKGRVPDWAAGRVEELRQQAAASKPASAPK